MIQMADVGIGISGQEGMQVQAETRVLEIQDLIIHYRAIHVGEFD